MPKPRLMSHNPPYSDFLEGKIKLSEKTGIRIEPSDIHPICKPHQRDIIRWGIEGGRRAVFAKFGLGKTIMQLEICRIIHEKVGGNALIAFPLGVKPEFQHDGEMLGIKEMRYITSTEDITDDCPYYITNYERIRMGDIDPSRFTIVTMDEASILRSLDTQTVDTIMQTFKQIPYRFVCTATPAPNRYLELTHYADFLGIMDRGQILTRFFQRDSTTAGNLTLYPRREKEFWHWMASWAVFITKPSDLGHDDEGYILPPLHIHRHRITYDRGVIVDKKTDQVEMYASASKSLGDAAKEKRNSLAHRLEKAKEILDQDPDSHYIIWHHLEDERRAIEGMLQDKDWVSVYGSQTLDQKEERLISFAQGESQYMITKPKIAGSGCNFQHHCHKAIFLGIDYKFNDFIQAIHRVYRFMQRHAVDIHIIHTDAEDGIMAEIDRKWTDHQNLESEMTEIIKKHGLNTDLYSQDLKREMFAGRQVKEGNGWVAINNDNVAEMPHIESDSVGMILSSIPFGNHYEYSENYNCFGHNETNELFFDQMDYLTPELYRTLKPGRICAIHVKDRIRYSYQNGVGFTSVEPFSDQTNLHFLKHGFHLLTRITITTDVVKENNQTYRLGWSEQCKDGSKMGAGLPEYVLVFRKPPTDTSNGYADEKVEKTKDDYSRSQWQLDAHAYWKSAGERLMDSQQLSKMGLDHILKLWKQVESEGSYDFAIHQRICEELDGMNKLPSSYMALPPISQSNEVWTDIMRVKTLNSDQQRKNYEKHICPLQLDVIERLITRYTNEGDEVLDPFGGIMSVPYQAVKMGRKGRGIELNASYWNDGTKHLRSTSQEASVLSLF